jgi:hypothetical protein
MLVLPVLPQPLWMSGAPSTHAYEAQPGFLPPATGVALGEACTIVLRGASSHILDEAERSLHDALCVLQQTVKDSRVVYGGGWVGGCRDCACGSDQLE